MSYYDVHAVPGELFTSRIERVYQADFTLMEGDPAEKFLDSRISVPDTSAIENHILARSWLTDCLRFHKSCPRSPSGPLPTRVIEVSPSKNPRVVRLHIASAGEHGRYVALSYCWGGRKPTLTTKETLARNMSSITVSTLSKVIQDAIECTRKLWIPFLWVDSLCIVQDSNEDKRREIAKMDSIFSGAIVTISAAAARNCEESFYIYRQEMANLQAERSNSLPFRGPDGNLGRLFLVPVKKDLTYEYLTDPIYKRGWTYQERVLSPRLLTFGLERISWDCVTSSRCDVARGIRGTLEPYTDLHRLLNAATRPAIAVDEVSELWRSVVEEYTRCELTVPSDKLPALSGCAARFGSLLADEYIAGLWTGDVILGSMWYVNRRHKTRARLHCPSWSWASVSAEVWYSKPDIGESWDITAEYIEHNIKKISGWTLYGAVEEATLSLRGHIRSIRWAELTDWFTVRWISDEDWQNSKKIGKIIPDKRSWLKAFDLGLGSPEPRMDYYLLELTRLRLRRNGLVLIGGEGGCFKRVAYFKIYTQLLDRNPQVLKAGWEMQTVTIS